MVETILKENEERRERIARRFDPVSGEGSIGERFRTVKPGSGETVCLPLSMKTLSLTSANYEFMRCLHDFPYWAATYVKIKRKGGGDDVPFILNRPQRKFVEALERIRLAGRPIRLILLKARQWGGSTCSQLYMAWLQLIHERSLNSLIIAHQGVGSDEIKDMFDRMIESYPLQLLEQGGEETDGAGEETAKKAKRKKMERVGRSGAIFRVPARNCKIKIGTAERPDSCRGGDYNLVHCSEVGIWRKTNGKSPEDILRSACSGVLLSPMTMIVYESTANGTGNFFHREYEAAKRGVSQFEPLFISWFDIDQYSLPFGNEEEKREFAERLTEGRCSSVPSSSRAQPGEYLWWLWEKGATLEAINWYVSERSKYSDHGLMASEYPSDDVEAFVHSGSKVFDKYKVETLRKGCEDAKIIGEIDENGFMALQSGGWRIWKLPDDSRGSIESRYVVVVDVGGRSAKADWSVIVVFDRMPLAWGEKPEVVAQWRGHTDFDLLTDRAAVAGRFYSDALLVIESNTLETHDRDREVDGDQSSFILNRLRDRYPNLYARPQSEETVVRGMPLRYGFHTNIATKPMIIATLVKVIREGLYIERDQDCIDEFLSYERRQNGSYGAIAGCHDDLLMTRAIGLHIIFHEMDTPSRPLPSNRHRRDTLHRRTPRSLAAW
ncbi:MAG: terminase [Muribaculaceae bacterium]|nr:terminase [Muribaculaceae bacterium]